MANTTTKTKTPSKSAKTNNDKLKENLSFQKELEETISKILTYKEACEANIVSIFWKNPDLVSEYEDINLGDFDKNHWRVFLEIARGIIIVEDKKLLDDVTVGLYLEKHPKLKEKFLEYGGMETIEKVKAYVKESNVESYILELRKWKYIMLLAREGYPVNNRLSDFVNMNVEDIYSEYEIKLNHIFSNMDFETKGYDISYNIRDRIEDWDAGDAVGLPLHNMPMLTRELGGLHLGDIMLLGGISNSGKSSFLRNTILPSIMKQYTNKETGETSTEKMVIFLNEEGIAKWQREMLIWVANNVYKKDIHKYQVREGKYSEEFKELLYKCASYLEELKSTRTLTLVPLNSYKTSTVIKLIKKYAGLGVKYFAVDTFKMDNADGINVSDNTRLQMVQNMTNLYNTVKESVKNVSLICTVQLTKATSKIRYVTQDALSESKNIVDPCATALFIRNVFDDEIEGKNKLSVFKTGGTNGLSTIPVKLETGKKYQLVFIAKGRESSAGVGSKQIVLEIDHSKNIINEIGYTYVPVDF